MKMPRIKDLSMPVKILIIAAIIITAAAWDYWLFIDKTEQIESYDNLHSELSSIRTAIANLEYTLDMFVNAKRIDNTTLMLIMRDVDHIDAVINKLTQSQDLAQGVKGIPQLSESIDTIVHDWGFVKTDLGRIKEAMPSEELMLVHNAVDVKAILLIEMTERDMGIINQKREDMLDGDVDALALATCGGIVLVGLLALSFFYWRSYTPIAAVMRVAGLISAGGVERFPETGTGHIQVLSIKLNLMMSAIKERMAAMDAKAGQMAGELKARTVRLETVNAMNASIAKSISLEDVLQTAVKEAVVSGGADGAAVYFAEEGFLRLKASSGLDRSFVNAGSALPLEAFDGMRDDISTRMFPVISEYSYEIMRPLVSGSGISALISVPIRRDTRTAGYFYAMFRGGLPDSGALFFEAAALGIESYISHTHVYYKEMNLRRFYERVTEQMPMGIAVFDRQGMCSYASAKLRKLLGAHPDFNFVNEYSVIEDEAFKGDDARRQVLSIYAGYTVEFTIEYQPSLTARFGFGTAPRRFRIKGLPLYDHGGEISSIMLLYEQAADGASAA